MENITYLTKFALAPMKVSGAYFSLMVLLFFLLLPKKIQGKATAVLGYRHDYIATVLLGLFFIVGLVYLAYPNYLDHVESTIASLGMILERGGEIYPFPDRYPYHGILYGPGLAITQTVFSHIGLPVLIESKISGLLAFFASILICLYLNKGELAKGYLIYLFPFGLYLFWNRSEPIFLILVCMTLLFADKKFGGKYLPVLIGILAGAASALKLHGAVYVFSAYLAATLGMTLSISTVLAITASAIISFFVFFLPPNISFVYFISYIKLATLHGLSVKMLLENIIYLSFVSIPVLISWKEGRKNRDVDARILIILSIEFVAAIVGAKPGAGTHHLLPFIPVNAYIIYRLYPPTETPGNSVIRVIYFALIIPAILNIFTLLSPMIKDWENFKKAGDEVRLLNNKYPDLVMGVTDIKNYPYAYLRVMLSSEQIDYASYMDLQFSGVSDIAMSKKMSECKIKNIILPNDGVPFSMISYYTAKPLLSQGIRRSFLDLYTKSTQGKYFSVYTCNKTANK